MSMPAASASTPTTPLGASHNEANVSSSRSSPSGAIALPVGGEKQNAQHPMGPPPNQSRPDGTHKPNFSPLTMTLPPDSQMLLGPALNPDDYFTSMLMSNPAPGYFGNSNHSGKDVSFFPPLEGMNATLAPSALNMSPSERKATDRNSNQFQNFGGMNNEMHLHLGDLKGVEFVPTNTSSINTPGAADSSWDAFIDEHSWSENNT